MERVTVSDDLKAQHENAQQKDTEDAVALHGAGAAAKKKATDTAAQPDARQPGQDGHTTARQEETEAIVEEVTQEAQDLVVQLEKARAEAAEFLEGWQRARAEFANYRKRVDREREGTYQHAVMSVLKQLLPVIDDLERAMSNTPPEIAEHGWVKGIGLIEQKLHKLLEDSGLVAINPLGEPFDPTRHEAIGTEASTEVTSGHVASVLQKGYAYGETVLRPAIVRVAE